MLDDFDGVLDHLDGVLDNVMDAPGFMTPPKTSYDAPGFMTPPRTPLKRVLITPPDSDDEGEDFTYMPPPDMLPGPVQVFASPDPILQHLRDPRVRAEYQRRMAVLHDLVREGDRLAAYVGRIADYNNVSPMDAAQNAPQLLRGVVKDLRKAAGDYESVRFRTSMRELP